VAVCAALAGLVGLRELSIQDTLLVPGNVVALGTLTGLTRLEVVVGSSSMSSQEAAVLARSLHELRHLELSVHELGTAAGLDCLAAIGKLQHLTSLQLHGSSGLTARGVMMLTSLRCLQQLVVEKNESVTDDVLEKFWGALRQQR
jgi:hypothetical protein